VETGPINEKGWLKPCSSAYTAVLTAPDFKLVYISYCYYLNMYVCVSADFSVVSAQPSA